MRKQVKLHMIFGLLLGLCFFALPVFAQQETNQIEPAFGIKDYSVKQVFSFAFQAQDPYCDSVLADLDGYRWMDDSSSCSERLIAPVELPSGVVIDFIGLDYCDERSDTGADWTLELRDLSGDHINTLVGTITPPTRTGCGYAYNSTPLNYQYNTNEGHHLGLFLEQNFLEPFGFPPEMSFRGAEIWYKLKVSPAPGTATFSDVPTGNPFFQYVEALVASGITAGCGGGNYCPDAPLTRGQMAVFLSKALGLHWPY